MRVVTAAHQRRVQEKLVRDAMVTRPKTLRADALLGAVRGQFSSQKVHLVLLVREGELVATVERDDLRSEMRDDCLASSVGRLDGRVINPDVPVGVARELMRRTSRRRLAVVDRTGTLLGLLCLKKTWRGFCSDSDVASREAERRGLRTASPRAGERAGGSMPHEAAGLSGRPSDS